MRWIKKGWFGRVKEYAIGGSAVNVNVTVGLDPKDRELCREALKLWRGEMRMKIQTSNMTPQGREDREREILGDTTTLDVTGG